MEFLNLLKSKEVAPKFMNREELILVAVI